MVNSYYSDSIEGQSTDPVDIGRAMRQDSSAAQEKRDLQIESRIHIEVQDEITQRLSHEPHLNVASPEFLSWVHERFYSRLLIVCAGCVVMRTRVATSTQAPCARGS